MSSSTWRAGALTTTLLVFCMIAGSRGAAAQGAPERGFVDRTGHGHTTAAKPAPIERPVPIPFMSKIRLNLEREEILRQEGDGHETRYRSFSPRALEPGQRVVEGLRTYGKAPRRYASCPREAFSRRLVFGYESDTYSYHLNPHTGRYDMLRIGLAVRDTSTPDYYAHFTRVRDHLVKTLGQPDEQGFMVTHKADKAHITPKNLHAPGLKHRAYALAYWHTRGLHVKLTTMPLPPDKGLASVVQIELSTRPFDIEASKAIDSEYEHRLRPFPKGR